jgi:hypothetical protein
MYFFYLNSIMIVLEIYRFFEKNVPKVTRNFMILYVLFIIFNAYLYNVLMDFRFVMFIKITLKIFNSFYFIKVYHNTSGNN